MRLLKEGRLGVGASLRTCLRRRLPRTDLGEERDAIIWVRISLNTSKRLLQSSPVAVAGLSVRRLVQARARGPEKARISCWQNVAVRSQAHAKHDLHEEGREDTDTVQYDCAPSWNAWMCNLKGVTFICHVLTA